MLSRILLKMLVFPSLPAGGQRLPSVGRRPGLSHRPLPVRPPQYFLLGVSRRRQVAESDACAEAFSAEEHRPAQGHSGEHQAF